MWTATRRRLARRLYQLAIRVDPEDDRLRVDVVAAGGGRAMVVRGGGFEVSVLMDNDERFALATALTCPVGKLRDVDLGSAGGD